MRVFVTKLLFRWLPVGTRLFRQKEWTSNHCHLCGLPETVDHLYQCPKRTKWQSDSATALNNLLCQECTSPSLRKTIVKNVTAWLGQDNTPNHVEIGWDVLMRGYIPCAWATAQEQYYRANGFDPKTKSGIGWSVKLSSFLWARIHTLWKQRCSDIHDRDQKARLSREHQEAIAKTRAIYSRRNDMLASDRVLLDASLQDRLQMPPRSLAAWVKTTWQVVKISIAEQFELNKRGCQDIRSFFIRRPRPPPDPDPDPDSGSSDSDS